MKLLKKYFKNTFEFASAASIRVLFLGIILVASSSPTSAQDREKLANTSILRRLSHKQFEKKLVSLIEKASESDRLEKQSVYNPGWRVSEKPVQAFTAQQTNVSEKGLANVPTMAPADTSSKAQATLPQTKKKEPNALKQDSTPKTTNKRSILRERRIERDKKSTPHSIASKKLACQDCEKRACGDCEKRTPQQAFSSQQTDVSIKGLANVSTTAQADTSSKAQAILPEANKHEPQALKQDITSKTNNKRSILGELNLGKISKIDPTSTSELQKNSPEDSARDVFSQLPRIIYGATCGPDCRWHETGSTAADFFYQPLYWEESNLERYGTNKDRLQPLISGARFFGKAPLLPLKIILTPPSEEIRDLSNYPAGLPAPWVKEFHGLSKKAILPNGS